LEGNVIITEYEQCPALPIENRQVGAVIAVALTATLAITVPKGIAE